MKRLTVAERKESILKACVKLANTKSFHYKCLTRDQIARGANCSPSLITHYFGGMRSLHKALLDYAIRTGAANVLIQAILNREFTKAEFLKRVDLKTRDKIRKAIAF